VGGMAKALRTIPVVLKIAGDMRRVSAPGALLANFTNPSGLVTQALAQYAPGVAAVGVCNSAFTTKMEILEQWVRLAKSTASAGELEPRSQLDALGLNHLTWYRGFKLDGEDIWSRVLDGFVEQLRSDPDPEWDYRTVEALGMLPNSYLQYYYDTAHKLAEQQKWPPSRAEEVMEVEKDLLRQYADPSLSELPPDLMKRGGAYYSTVAAQLLNAHYNNLGETHIVNVAQAGAVPGLPADWVMELPCRVDRDGVHPLPAGPLPAVCAGLVAQVKAYELLTVEAGVHGDRRAAFQALLAHPLGPKAGEIQAVLEDMLETNRPYLPQFWKSGE
jgi:6-phospho-beta-glucosidase